MNFTLPWPPTVNHYYTVARGRKILSTKGRKYKEDGVLLAVIASSEMDYKILKGPISVFIRAYPPDKRKRDLDNLLKPVLDVLTTAGIYKDDSEVADLRIQRFNQVDGGKIEVSVGGTKGA